MRRRSTPVVLLLVLLSSVLATPAVGVQYRQVPTSVWVPDGPVHVVVRNGDVVYLGGDFTSFTNSSTGRVRHRGHLAAVDAVTGEPTSWNPGADGDVWALALGADGVVYAGGDFTTVRGQPHQRLVAIAPTGDPVTAWGASANAQVRDLQLTPAGLYAAGRFGSVNGVRRPGLVRLDPATGAVDPTFATSVRGGPVHALTLASGGDQLLVAGGFSHLGGQERPYLGSISAATGEVSAWQPPPACARCSVFDVAARGDRAYVAAAGGGGRVAAYSLTSDARLWRNKGDGDAQAIAVHRGVLYVGGHFATWEGRTRRQLVALDAATGAVKRFRLSVRGYNYPGVWSVVADASGLLVGGGFELASGSGARYAAFPRD